MASSKIPGSVLFTIFGAKGDLTRRKLIPALYNLFLEGHLKVFSICCVDYQETDEKEFRADLLNGINEFSRTGAAAPKQWNEFRECVSYLQADFNQAATYSSLKSFANDFDKRIGHRSTRIFYFAVAPKFIEIISEGLYIHKVANKVSNDRIVIEKPFGTDFTTARNLNLFLNSRFAEKQLYRIDHYLGKETVQNMMAFRFANHVFEPLWNNKFIDHVQITVAEQVKVGKRGGYYDGSGALRDMIQNHLLQLLCIVAMDAPEAYKAELIRDAKTKVLKSMRVYSEEEIFKNIVRGQYVAGTYKDEPTSGYREEEQVPSDSTTETFVSGKFFIDNKRWKGVPFFIATGKALPRQVSVIVIQFKDSPNKIFKQDTVPNRLVISIQPELEISLLFESKVPGLEMKLKAVDMDFTYQESYTESLPEAYEALLLDVMEGDPTLFMRADQVEAAWKVVMPILNAWKSAPRKQLHYYQAGTWGPPAARKLVQPYAEKWFELPRIERMNEALRSQ